MRFPRNFRWNIRLYHSQVSGMFVEPVDLRHDVGGTIEYSIGAAVKRIRSGCAVTSATVRTRDRPESALEILW